MDDIGRLGTVNNRVLLSLPKEILDRLYALLEPVEIRRGERLYQQKALSPYVYFVNAGLVSLIKTMRDGSTAEIATIGIEGVVGIAALFGTEGFSFEAVVQVPGIAFRIRPAVLKEEIANSPVLQHIVMQKYVRFTIGHIAQAAACNRLHDLKQRFYRWLLTASDAAFSDTFPATQECLAVALGVQRSAVSLAANKARIGKLIAYSRGTITIKNRTALERLTCECYHARRACIAKLFSRSG